MARSTFRRLVPARWALLPAVPAILAGIGPGCSNPAEPDCPDSSDPRVHYVAGSHENPAVCQTVRFVCPTGSTPFSDDCGCGCIDP